VAARAEVTIGRPAEVVWARIGDFGDLSWTPNVTSLELEAGIRVFQLGGSLVRHRLVRHDDRARSYTYALAGVPESASTPAVPATEATLSVAGDGPSACTVTWSSDTDERKGSAEGLRAFFQGILDDLKNDLEHA